ncbi:hypothetical protein CR492_12910 [Methylocella silvestris]|uniref:Uncharacterized protein n=1 Tax=Methylocella silvestris TaxID=199596 RepID=A0A2J7TFS5_METSI|nr:hypothetical protein CR492_12910 [Methylocella silvestris]
MRSKRKLRSSAPFSLNAAKPSGEAAVQLIRFDQDLRQRVDRAYQEWQAHLPAGDESRKTPRRLLGVGYKESIIKPVDKRFIEHLTNLGLPFEWL